jgi:hypothetical protein
MPKFEIEFTYSQTGYEIVDADSEEHAENEFMKTLREFYPEAIDIEIVEVKEING